MSETDVDPQMFPTRSARETDTRMWPLYSTRNNKTWVSRPFVGAFFPLDVHRGAALPSTGRWSWLFNTSTLPQFDHGLWTGLPLNSHVAEKPLQTLSNILIRVKEAAWCFSDVTSVWEKKRCWTRKSWPDASEREQPAGVLTWLFLSNSVTG